MKRTIIVFCLILLTFLVALPALAADRVVPNGVDLWWTRGNGGTYADFSKQPIPAGFFCFKSEPYTGRIIFRGLPLATGVKNQLGRTDTIVQRLDDAVFSDKGVAVTRIQVRAMTFESVTPVKTTCGDFNVRVTLDGQQPITRMQIVRDDEHGGHFLAPIAVNVKLAFAPVSGPARESLEITKRIRFAPNPQAKWADKPGAGGLQHAGFVLVDTDGDRIPDTYLPGTSFNFAAGFPSRPEKSANVTCHISDSCGHCTDGTVTPANPSQTFE